MKKMGAIFFLVASRWSAVGFGEKNLPLLLLGRSSDSHK
jgi:hypothetical protein